MQYLTYEEYLNIGGVCDLTAFNRNIIRACGIIDNETHGRVSCMLIIPDEVKHCLRDLVEYMETNSITQATVTSRSQSVGGVSESESYGTKTADDMYGDICNILYDYLLSVKDNDGFSLLYRGRGC